MRLEVFHTDPFGILNCYDVEAGTPLRLEHYPIPWDGSHWRGPRGPIDDTPQHLEHFGHHFRLKLAKPTSRTPKEGIFPLWMPPALLVYVLAILYLTLLPTRPPVELIDLRDSSCGFYTAPHQEPELNSYEPLEVARAEPRNVAGAQRLRTRGSSKPVEDWGHPLALQLEDAVHAEREPLALCFRQSGAAGVRRRGTLLVDATVTEAGTLQDIEISADDFAVPWLARCVAGVFAQIDIQGPPENVAIRYPVRFILPN